MAGALTTTIPRSSSGGNNIALRIIACWRHINKSIAPPQDRFLAHHAAVVYFWVLIAMWMISPTLAYNFSELIEARCSRDCAEIAPRFLGQSSPSDLACPTPVPVGARGRHV